MCWQPHARAPCELRAEFFCSNLQAFHCLRAWIAFRLQLRSSRIVGGKAVLGSESKNFLGLCKLLSSSYGEPALEQFRPGIPSDRWGEILALANRHRVSPAMRQALKSGYATAAVPDAIARSLENVYRLNERRNMLIVRQFTEAAALLNRSGIFPAPLKTLVNMLESPADELGKWTTRDIDLLVTRSDFLKAGKLLEE